MRQSAKLIKPTNSNGEYLTVIICDKGLISSTVSLVTSFPAKINRKDLVTTSKNPVLTVNIAKDIKRSKLEI